MRRLLGYVVFLAVLLFILPSTAVGAGVSITVDGEAVSIPPGDQPAFIRGERTYVPLRVVGENLGAEVHWVPDTKQVIIYTGADALPAPVWSGASGEVRIIVDGEVKEFPADYGQPFITNNRTVIPLRAVGEALGCDVHWDAGTRTVAVRSRVQPPQDVLPPETPPEKPPAGALLRELAAFKTNLRLPDGSVVNSAELLDYTESDFSEAGLRQLEGYLAELKKYARTITLPDGMAVASADLTIMGESMATAGRLGAWAAREYERKRWDRMRLGIGPRDWDPSRAFFEDLAVLYLDIGAEYGIRGDLAFAQAAKETCYWTYGGDVEPDQNNYCGLWATGAAFTGDEPLNGCDPRQVMLEPGRHGATFASPKAGVEAHIQHLYAYASKDPLPRGKALLSPRFQYVSRGCAPTWHGLNARWAVPGPTYGQSIIQDYWLKAL